jgi:hypothetical protein
MIKQESGLDLWIMERFFGVKEMEVGFEFIIQICVERVVMGNKMLGEMGFFEVVVSLGQNG